MVPCAVILTDSATVYKAVTAHLQYVQEEIHPQGTVYGHGSFRSPHQQWNVAVAEIGASGIEAALEGERAIRHFQPEIILFVGIAGGLTQVKVGDVVVATKVYGYEAARVEHDGMQGRPQIAVSTYLMQQRARAIARSANWLERLQGPSSTRAPKVYVGPIASGDKVLTSSRSGLRNYLDMHFNDALAIDMEGCGFLTVAHANAPLEALIVRGIAYVVERKSKVDDATHQELAARHAAAFAFEILAQLSETYHLPAYSIHQDSPQTAMTLQHASAALPDDSEQDQQSEAIEIFFSYVAKDEKQLEQLQKQLVVLKNNKIIWYARKLAPGRQLNRETDAHLNRASIIVLLVSPDYLASEGKSVEVHRALERSEAGEAVVIPVLLRPIPSFAKASFGQLASLPFDKEGKALSLWKNTDEAYAHVAEEIGNVAKKMKQALDTEG